MSEVGAVLVGDGDLLLVLLLEGGVGGLGGFEGFGEFGEFSF
jgi:hypothetical protein